MAMSWVTKSTEDILNDILRHRDRARKAVKFRYPITKSEFEWRRNEANGDPDKLASLERDFIEIEPMPVEPKEIFRPINRAARRAKKGNNGVR
jgi:hypothetical protein